MSATAADTAAETLARWQAEEAAIRARATLAPAPMRPQDLAGRSALEAFHAMMRGEAPGAPIAATLDFLMVHAEHGLVVFQGTPKVRHYNPMGAVHGGWFATLLDSALGCAVASVLPAGKAYTTLELKVNIVRALTERVPVVRAEGRTIHVGGQTATADARLVGHDGKLYAHASTTCLVFDARPPKA